MQHLPGPRRADRAHAAVRRVTVTIACLLLFVFAVDVALTFARPSEDAPTVGRTIGLFMALGALPAAGLATYMAGAGEYRVAAWAALIAGLLLVGMGVGDLASATP